MSTSISVTNVQISVPGANVARSVLTRLRAAASESLTRQALTGLDAHILRDIGATEGDAESRRPCLFIY